MYTRQRSVGPCDIAAAACRAEVTCHTWYGRSIGRCSRVGTPSAVLAHLMFLSHIAQQVVRTKAAAMHLALDPDSPHAHDHDRRRPRKRMTTTTTRAARGAGEPRGVKGKGGRLPGSLTRSAARDGDSMIRDCETRGWGGAVVWLGGLARAGRKGRMDGMRMGEWGGGD